MTLVYMDDGLIDMYEGGDAVLSNIKLHLFSNNHTPAVGDVLAGYTESTAPGYAAVGLGALPPVPAAPVLGISYRTWLDVTFSFAGAGNIYGYYVTDAAVTVLLWAERYSAAPFVAAAGLTFTVTPKLGLADQSSW